MNASIAGRIDKTISFIVFMFCVDLWLDGSNGDLMLDFVWLRLLPDL